MLIPSISRYMTRAPYVLAPKDKVSTARAVMREHGVHHLPVLDRNAKLVGIDAVEVTLAEESPAGGRPIAELGMPRDASVVAVVRDRRVVVPRGDTVLLPGDEVIALVTVDSEDAVRGILVG